MGWIPKKAGLKSMKEALSKAADSISEKASGVDLNEFSGSLKEKISSVKESLSENISSIDVNEMAGETKKSLLLAAGKTKDVATSAYSATVEKSTTVYEEISIKVKSVDYSEFGQVEYYRETFSRYKDMSASRVSEYFKSTFEVDRDTMVIVEDVRRNLPVPAKSMEDIFDQCKQEAMRRAIAAFCLSGVIRDIDQHSAEKYENLSDSYKQFSERTGFAMFDDPNFSDMKDQRHEAKEKWTYLEDGYNKSEYLDPRNADIEHVIARKEYFDDVLLRAGTTDDEFCGVINSKENLVFANSSLNRALKDKNAIEFLDANGVPRPDNPDIVDVTIKSTGEVVTVRKSDVQEALDRAEENRQSHRLDAAMEIGSTMVKTGATMAVQQVVGLMVLETIDVFVDEIKQLTLDGGVMNGNGLLDGAKERVARIRQRLSDRFEERHIWERAKVLGIESGVAGALNVIPHILISLVVKMPAFVLAIIRECTLSLVRCVRLMASNSPDKLDAIGVILAGSVTAIAGVYVADVIGSAIVGVPLLAQFNVQISNVISGIIVVAVPLSAIYVFDQNKTRITFMIANVMSRIKGESVESGLDADKGGPVLS